MIFILTSKARVMAKEGEGGGVGWLGGYVLKYYFILVWNFKEEIGKFTYLEKRKIKDVYQSQNIVKAFKSPRNSSNGGGV